MNSLRFVENSSDQGMAPRHEAIDDYRYDENTILTCHQFEVIVKITERCNINCTYCYFFNKDDKGYERHPKYISMERAKEMAQFIRQGAADLCATEVLISLHGGEPLMLGRKRFEALCDMFVEELGDQFELSFRMQTNGVLITKDWVNLFNKYNMHVGVSIDGDEEANDTYRVDHQGRGTYTRVKKGIDVLQAAVAKRELRPVGGLCVVNPSLSGKTIYRHLVDELGFTGFNFLLPLDDYDYLSADPVRVQGYGTFLRDAFDEYVADDNPKIRVRMFDTAITALVGGPNYAAVRDLVQGFAVQSIVLSSDGEIGPDDTLRPSSGQFFTGKHTIYNSSLMEYLDAPSTRKIRAAANTFSDKCNTCKWRNACYAGPLINRYSRDDEFNNPSALCDALYSFHEHVANYLVANGVPQSIIDAGMAWRP